MQRRIDRYFLKYRRMPGTNDLLYVVSSSDDDVPMVSRICQAGAAANPLAKEPHQPAGDGAVVFHPSHDDSTVAASTKRRRFEAEAEENSALDDDDDDQDSDDSFVVPDHCSESSSASSDRVPVGVMVRALCAKLHNRRQCVQCAQCLRFMCAISDFAKAISTALSVDS